MEHILAALRGLFGGVDAQGDLRSSKPASPWPSLPPGVIVVFLNFDGVMHRAENGSFERMQHLETLMASRQELCLVLSTSWRLNATPEFLRSLFPSSLRGRIYGTTPEIADAKPHQRERECLLWARLHRSTRFIAIDDDASFFSQGCEFLFLTDRYRGLDAAALIELEGRLDAI